MIQADRFSIQKKKLGYFRFGLINEAILENARVHLYGKRETSKPKSGDRQNLSFNALFSKKSLPSFSAKRISSIVMKPVQIKLHDEQSEVSRISSSKAVIRLKKHTIIIFCVSYAYMPHTRRSGRNRTRTAFQSWKPHIFRVAGSKDAFGMTRNTNVSFEDGLPYDTPSQLPANSPSGEKIRQFLAGPFATLLDGALANLNKIGSSFQITLTADETGDEAVEVDYGDVLLLKSMLQAFKAILWVISSYDIDLDPVQLEDNLDNHPFNINTDLLNPNPEFIKLLSGGGTTLKTAETDINAAINSYNAASTFIRSKSDSQGDDLITLDSEETTNEAEFRDILDRIKDSLENNRPVEIGDDALRVNFSEFFDDPISIRNHLPTFIYNACTGDYKGVGSFPDTNFSGIFPDGLPPDIQYAAVTGDRVTQDLWIRAVINTEEKGPVEAVWRFGGQDTTSRGDQVVWGHFYASPWDVSWGSENNLDLFVKIWFDVSGRVDVNFFHMSVPDIEVYSDLPSDSAYDQQGTTIMENRYIRHEY